MLGHGWAKRSRDYLVIVQDVIGFDPGTHELTFTHCVRLDDETRVRDEAWPRSWSDKFLDYQAWLDAGEPDGYVWGTGWLNAYPGISRSELAEGWATRLGRAMAELSLENDRFRAPSRVPFGPVAEAGGRCRDHLAGPHSALTPPGAKGTGRRGWCGAESDHGEAWMAVLRSGACGGGAGRPRTRSGPLDDRRAVGSLRRSARRLGLLRCRRRGRRRCCAVAALLLRRRWEADWLPPPAATALGLSLAFAVTWTFGAIGQARADDGPGPSFSAWLLAMAASLLAATPTVLLLRWSGGLLRSVCWLLGLVACIVSIPFLVWLVGIPALSWGRALMLHSGIRPLAGLRARGPEVRATAPAPWGAP